MFRKVLLTIGLLLAAQVAVLAQGTLKGTITDEKTGQPLISATVVVKQGDQIISGARTDFDGLYTIKGLQVGKYDVEVSYTGYATVKTQIDVKASGFTVYNEKLAKAGQTLTTVVVKGQKVPVIEIGTPETGQRISAEDIGRMPGNSVESIVSAVAGVGYSDGGTGSARGEEGMVTMQNGVRTRTGVNVPKEAIGEIQVILGGTPASIGEAIGGTQIITLKPPTPTFKGLVKYETYLDYRLYNSLVVWLTGPVVKTSMRDEEGNKTGERTLIGFRFTGTGSFSKFGYYRARDGRYRVVNDDKVAEIEQAPIQYDPLTGAVNYSAYYLRDNDFVTITRPNARNYYTAHDAADFKSYSIALQGALDFRFTELSSLVITGEYDYSYSPSTSLSYFPLNLHNAANGVSQTQNIVLTVDYTQRLKDPEVVTDPANPDERITPAVSKVMYNITAMYNRYMTRSFNERFGDDVFKYGHIGTFDRTMERSYEIRSDYNYFGTVQTAHVQNNWIERVNSYEPSPYNPILSNYTSQLYGMENIAPLLTNFNTIQYFNGLINGGSPGNVYGLFSNVGVQSTSYSKQINNYFYVQAKASALIKGHDIEIGFQYDQYNASVYSLAAASLWTLMRQSANAHITQLDLDHPHEYFIGSDLYVDYDRKISGEPTHFDQVLREKDGKGATEWLNIDGYSPDDYERFGGLSMFSADELFNSGNAIVSYYGYQHDGERYNGSTWSFDDFFNPKAGESRRPLPPFSPIYAAGYIQDKFYFSDLIFNVGVRVDYYDGNQMVLKDPYLLYESYTLGDLVASGMPFNSGLDKNNPTYFPEGFVEDREDWVVYVDEINYKDGAVTKTPTIRGYRHNGVWYNAEGKEVSSPITGETGKSTPYRTVDGQDAFANHTVHQSAFEDYRPQIVPMPRIAFSFPVNDRSQFKANYDIIARRPSSGWQADYYRYLYMSQISSINNPNLKPERITNYELGFQQALNKDKTAAISLSAYYKETRDLIQLVQYAGADPNSNYYSYDNLDFKTIKGFSLSFDMRQSNNVRINANYTLQYAEGTGLSTTTMTELIKEGYTTLKMLNPISDDRRHEFKANVDYRLGPNEGWHFARRVKGKDGQAEKKDVYPFQNFGVNFLAVAQSGRPYTRAFSNRQNTIVGSYRGARLPWGFYFNVVVDKSFPISVSRGEGKPPRPTMLNVAVTINNLFDIRNVVGVFSVTGNPTDDGYLSDPETQSTINAWLDPQSYRDMYAIMLNNSYWNYSSPRTIRVSLTYSF